MIADLRRERLNNRAVSFVNAIVNYCELPWALTEEKLIELFGDRDQTLLSSFRQKIVENIVFNNLDPLAEDELSCYSIRDEETCKPEDEVLSIEFLPKGFVQENSRSYDLFKLKLRAGHDLEYPDTGVVFKDQSLHVECLPVFRIFYAFERGHFEVEHITCVYCNGLPKEGSLEYIQVEKIIRMMVEIDHRYGNSALLEALEKGRGKVNYQQVGSEREYNNEQQRLRRAQMLRIYKEYLQVAQV